MKIPLSRNKPLIAVLYDIGSASASTIRAAAGTFFEVLFVCDRKSPHVRAALNEIQLMGQIIDSTGLTWSELVQKLRQVNPDGVLTFSELRLVEASKLAEELSLAGHCSEVSDRLTDKLLQRSVLKQSGVQATGSALVTRNINSLATKIGFPAVLKPRVGSGSAFTQKVKNQSELVQAMKNMPNNLEFVLEEFLDGDSSIAGKSWGDYVSVETAHYGTGRRQICVTGKFPLAPPFRETGMIFPSTLPPDVMREVLSIEDAAIESLGIRFGLTHTEIKLTNSGPKIIEVNGRLGGHIPEIFRRATGCNLVRLAMEISIGRIPQILPTECGEVYFQYFLVPPQGRFRISSLQGLDRLTSIPGILHVESRSQVGDVIDAQMGTQSLIGVVYGSAYNHLCLESIIMQSQSIFQPSFDEIN